MLCRKKNLTDHLASTFCLLFSFLMFVFCVVLGGARGEFLICFIILALILLSFPTRKKNSIFLIFIFVAASIWLLLLFAEILDELLIYQMVSFRF